MELEDSIKVSSTASVVVAVELEAVVSIVVLSIAGKEGEELVVVDVLDVEGSVDVVEVSVVVVVVVKGAVVVVAIVVVVVVVSVVVVEVEVLAEVLVVGEGLTDRVAEVLEAVMARVVFVFLVVAAALLVVVVVAAAVVVAALADVSSPICSGSTVVAVTVVGFRRGRFEPATFLLKRRSSILFRTGGVSVSSSSSGSGLSSGFI